MVDDHDVDGIAEGADQHQQVAKADGKAFKSHYAAIRKWCVRDLAEQKTAEQRLKNAQEAGQRVKQPQAPVTHYADLAEIDARRKAIEDKYKN